MTIRTSFGALALVCTLAPAAMAADHIVSPDLVAARLQGASTDRAANLAAVQTAFATPAARQAAATLHVDLDATTARLGSLSDAELADLAARTAALSEDPVAGALTQKQWIWILVGVAAVTILLIAVL